MGFEDLGLSERPGQRQTCSAEVLSELQQQLHALSQGQMMDWEQKPGQKVRVPTWSRFHLNKVHERLYLDASERQDRKRALQESIQQAREFEVLDIFRSQHPWSVATAGRI
ncbi:unnamed protein product [Durusdinium trenchii]|uniref:Uncharacterized protein n=1 Tax=Durusdinium trenchii TaxID=1381693 RepID=A0ABP0KJP2_9DINO